MPPVVTVTTVLYNSAGEIRDCVHSIRPDIRSGLIKAVAVDNCSPDESAQVLQDEFPDVVLVRSPVNRGFSGGCNLALPHLEGKYWLLLNPDIVAPENGIRELVTWMDAHPEVAAASPEIVDGDGSPWFPGRNIPTLSRVLLEAARLHRLLPPKVRGAVFRGNYWQGGGDQIGVDYVPGAVLIVRREALEAVGSLSESYFMYGEDIEWCWRMRKAGWKIGVCASATFQHLDGTSGRRTWGDEERRHRILNGWYHVLRDIHGAPYARILMLANAFAFGLEAVHPAREAERRNWAQHEASAYWQMFLRGAMKA